MDIPIPNAQTNGNNKVPIVCEKCGQRFSVDMPPIEVSNNLRTSLIIAVHPKLIYCPNSKCRQPRTFVFSNQYLVNVGTMPVSDDAVEAIEGSKIIKPTLGLVQ